ncbi:MAG: C-GCAxxG-C-C family protein [Bacillota bacterium]
MATELEKVAGASRVSRRELFAGTGAFAAGVALGTLFGGAGLRSVSRAQAQDIPPWPWPYHKLDPDRVARRAYEGYWKGACNYGVAEAIIGELADVAGYPFTLIPADMFRYGEGGVVGWSTLCGALNGAAAAICLVTPKDAYARVINELMGWYTQVAFPQYRPAGGADLPTSVSGSPLCHVSVTTWCKVSGYGENSKERKERCARLTADVAAQAVRLLNAHFDGQFTATYAAPASVKECMDCHGPSHLNNTRGKMDCVQCHEPHA